MRWLDCNGRGDCICKKKPSVWPLCSIFRNCCHVCRRIKNPHISSMHKALRNIHIKFGSNWFSITRREGFWKSKNDNDNYRWQVMAITHMALWARWAKQSIIWLSRAITLTRSHLQLWLNWDFLKDLLWRSFHQSKDFFLSVSFIVSSIILTKNCKKIWFFAFQGQYNSNKEFYNFDQWRHL